jgi:hypothetical protein
VTEVPEWRELEPGRWVACHFAELDSTLTVTPI